MPLVLLLPLLLDFELLYVNVGLSLVMPEFALLTAAHSLAQSEGLTPDWSRTQSRQPEESVLAAEQTHPGPDWLQLFIAWTPARSLVEEHWLAHASAALELLAAAVVVVELGVLLVVVVELGTLLVAVVEPGTAVLIASVEAGGLPAVRLAAAHSALAPFSVSPSRSSTHSKQTGDSCSPYVHKQEMSTVLHPARASIAALSEADEHKEVHAEA